MKLTELLNASNVFLFTLTNGEKILGQVTREGEEFLQVGYMEGEKMQYQWVNKHHVINVVFKGTNFKNAMEKK